MSYVVRIYCGGARGDFLLSTSGLREDEFVVRKFRTPELATQAGNGSTCVQCMGWDFEVEQTDD